MAYKKYARTCDECGKGMNEGYCIDSGCEYYCSDACLHKHYSPKEWEEAYADGDGDSYWTTWDEDPDAHMVDEDDPAPNKLSVELADAVDTSGKVDEEKVVKLLAEQLRLRWRLDHDKYEFVNWTVTCDVQVKEENKS
jgi:hypothetical protein